MTPPDAGLLRRDAAIPPTPVVHANVGPWLDLGIVPHAPSEVIGVSVFESAERALFLVQSERRTGETVSRSAIEAVEVEGGVPVGDARVVMSGTLREVGAVALAEGWLVFSTDLSASRGVHVDARAAPTAAIALDASVMSGRETGPGATLLLRADTREGGAWRSETGHAFVRSVAGDGTLDGLRRLTTDPLRILGGAVTDHHAVVLTDTRALRFDHRSGTLVSDHPLPGALRPIAHGVIADDVALVVADGEQWSIVLARADTTPVVVSTTLRCETASVIAEPSAFVVRCTSTDGIVQELRIGRDGSLLGPVVTREASESPSAVTRDGRITARGRDDDGLGDGTSLALDDAMLGTTSSVLLDRRPYEVAPIIEAALGEHGGLVLVRTAERGDDARMWQLDADTEIRVRWLSDHAHARPRMTTLGAFAYERDATRAWLSRLGEEGLAELVELDASLDSVGELEWNGRALLVRYDDASGTPVRLDRLDLDALTFTTLDPPPIGALTAADDGSVLEWERVRHRQLLRVRDPDGSVFDDTSVVGDHVAGAWSCGASCFRIFHCENAAYGGVVQLERMGVSVRRATRTEGQRCGRDYTGVDGGLVVVHVEGNARDRDVALVAVSDPGGEVLRHLPESPDSLLVPGRRSWEITRPMGRLPLSDAVIRARAIELVIR